MPVTYSCLRYHIVFGTCARTSLIPEAKRHPLYAYMRGIVNNLGGTIVQIGGTSDHVHLLVAAPPRLSVAELVSRIKANSSRWVSKQWPSFYRFAWQSGYGAFTVGVREMDRLIAYIRHQKEHHEKLAFIDEMSKLLASHGIDPALATSSGETGER